MGNNALENCIEPVAIKVIGLGGCGGNITGLLYEDKIPDIDYYALNTDIQALFKNKVKNRIQIGKKLTDGKGAGADFEKGYLSMLQDIDLFENILEGTQMVVFIAGLGGGTGTGSIIPAIEKCKSMGIITMCVVTIPFSFEGNKRKKGALEVASYIKGLADTTIEIQNDRLLTINDKKTSLKSAFSKVDIFLNENIRNILSVINAPGTINLDFADLRSIISNSREAFMGSGRGKGKNRASEALKNALESPLLDKDISNFEKIFINISGSEVSLIEVNYIVGEINNITEGKADVIFGTTDTNDKDEIFITLLLSGLNDKEKMQKL
ncbi:MAG: cell division FtsZ family protein [Candidatus Muirbacterium halophilum]|nr:cell division FtsZ family protein [Candidatus Muirbacterium halophilum]MCK9475260.1 cell division FtsZ family protein [Candidatus Muirbacterium halophilum]